MNRTGRTAFGWAAAFATTCLLVQAPPGATQTVGERLASLDSTNAEMYLRPATTGIVGAMNSGLFHTARVHRPWGFDIGIRAMGTLVTDQDKSFTPVFRQSEFSVGEQTYRYDETFELVDYSGTPVTSSATVAGGDGAMWRVREGSPFHQDALAAGLEPWEIEELGLEFPGGLDTPVIPYGAIQASLGLPYGTELGVRFIPRIDAVDDLGTLASFGFIGKHSVSQHLGDDFPVDLAVVANFQRLELGEYLQARTRAFGLVAGRKFLLLSLYGGATLESGSVDVEYRIDNEKLIDDGSRVAFTDEYGTSARFTGGATLHLAGLLLNADYSAGERQTVSAKFIISVR